MTRHIQIGRKKKLELVAAESNQTIVTDYFEIVEKISLLVQENKKLHDLLQSVTSTPSDNGFLANVTPILKNLMENATRNAGKQKTEETYRGIKKVCHSFIYKCRFHGLSVYSGKYPRSFTFIENSTRYCSLTV